MLVGVAGDIAARARKSYVGTWKVSLPSQVDSSCRLSVRWTKYVRRVVQRMRTYDSANCGAALGYPARAHRFMRTRCDQTQTQLHETK